MVYGKDYHCSCHLHYPNNLVKRKNGKWKCVDRYECVKDLDPQSKCRFIENTKCRRVVVSNG